MGVRRLKWTIVTLVSVLIAAAFQNCQNFEAVDPAQIASLLSTGTPADTHSDHIHLSTEIPFPEVGAVDSVGVGEFKTLAAGKALNLTNSGRVLLVTKPDGKTRVDVHALGLPANAHLGVHVHVDSCANGAGGHYKIDPTVEAVVEANEIWPSITTDPAGYGFGSKSVIHRARPDAVSVVIHGGPDKAKIACADLIPEIPGITSLGGTLLPLPGAGQTSQVGRAIMAVHRNGQTEVRVAARGFVPAAAYAAHIHTAACSEGGGTHYKIDPAITETVEANELWPKLVIDSNGNGLAALVSDHTVRADAKSLVIHGPDGTKLYCADLTDNLQLLALSKGLERFPELKGSATLERTAEGETKMRLTAFGLQTQTIYTAHVHNRPCSMEGGTHYKIDASVSTTVEANEIFLRLQADAFGADFVDVIVPHIARPDAVSIVLHDPADGAKLACADLY